MTEWLGYWLEFRSQEDLAPGHGGFLEGSADRQLVLCDITIVRFDSIH